MSAAELETVTVDVAPVEPPAAPAPEVHAPLTKSPAEEWAELPRMFGAIVSAFPPLKELKDVYTDANCLAWGAAMEPVARARGWTVSAVLAWLGPLVPLGMATHTLLTPTVLTVARVIAEAKAARAKAKAAAEPVEKKTEEPAPAA